MDAPPLVGIAVSSRVLLRSGAILCLLAGASPAGAAAPSRSAVLVVVGLGGDKAHYETLVGAGTAIADGLRRNFGYGDNAILLTEDGPGAEGVTGISDSGGIRSAVRRLADGATSADRMLVVLIGHSSGEGEHWRLNIPGADLSATDWRDLLASHPGTVGVIAAAPGAAHLAKVLSGPRRIILSSTRHAEIRTWAFLAAITEILGPDAARDRPRTLWDLFRMAEQGIVRAFEEKGFMRNEHASLEDDGDGMGTESIERPGTDGKSAKTFRLAGSGSNSAGAPVESKKQNTSGIPDAEILRLAAEPDPPGFDAVILLHDEAGSINEDMTETRRRRVVTKIVTESGRNLANMDFTFPPGVDAEISIARTLFPDGQIMDADTHAVIEGMDPEDFPDELPEGDESGRRFVLHLSEAVPGAILDVEVKTSIRSFEIRGEYFDDLTLQADLPVRRAVVTVRYPRQLNLKVIPHNLPGQPVVSDAGRYARIVTYEAKDIEAVPDEPLSDPPDLRAGRLVFSSIGSWNEIARWYHAISRPVLRGGGEIKSLADRLTRGMSTNDEKTRALYEWVSEEIRYVAIPLGVHGWKPHMVPNILKWRYGDCKDKAALLITLLGECGIRSHMVLIGADMGDIVADAPRPTAFNHVIVARPAAGGVQFMDPTAEIAMFGTLPPMDQGRQALVIWGETGALVATPFDPPESNALFIDRVAGLQGSGDLAIEETRVSTGRWALERRTLLRHEGLANAKSAIAADLGRRIAGVLLDEYRAVDVESIDRPLTEVLRYLIRSGVKGALVLPWEPTPIDGISAAELRKTEISMGSTLLLDESTSVSGFDVSAENSEIENEMGESSIRVNSDRNRTLVRRRLRLTRPRAPAASYPDLAALAGVIPPGLAHGMAGRQSAALWMIVAAVSLIGLGAAGATLISRRRRRDLG